jgi:hypothetical protein
VLAVFPMELFRKLTQPGDAAVNDNTITGLISTSGALAALSLLARFLPRVKGVLDVMLDVDNYLKLAPRTETARAQMAERFTSLLGYIVRSEFKYGTIIFVAHSQGSVIVADMLRYLKHCVSPEDEKKLPNIVLFTMGSPLRQLYARRFPWLYEWTRKPNGNLLGPDPSELLAVTKWVNVYRTGDYVGRNLWGQTDVTIKFEVPAVSDHVPWDPKSVDLHKIAGVRPNAIEFPIGAGAHTRYWDRHGEMVAATLDWLIATATTRSSPAAR